MCVFIERVGPGTQWSETIHDAVNSHTNQKAQCLMGLKSNIQQYWLQVCVHYVCVCCCLSMETSFTPNKSVCWDLLSTLQTHRALIFPLFTIMFDFICFSPPPPPLTALILYKCDQSSDWQHHCLVQPVTHSHQPLLVFFAF